MIKQLLDFSPGFKSHRLPLQSPPIFVYGVQLHSQQLVVKKMQCISSATGNCRDVRTRILPMNLERAVLINRVCCSVYSVLSPLCYLHRQQSGDKKEFTLCLVSVCSLSAMVHPSLIHTHCLHISNLHICRVVAGFYKKIYGLNELVIAWM